MSSSNPSSPDAASSHAPASVAFADHNVTKSNWLSHEQWPEEIIACRYDRTYYLTRSSYERIREVCIRIQFASGTSPERCHELLQAIAPPQGHANRTTNSIHTDAGFAIVPAMSARFVDELD